MSDLAIISKRLIAARNEIFSKALAEYTKIFLKETKDLTQNEIEIVSTNVSIN